MKIPALSQVEFSPGDHTKAEEIARALGYGQFAYTSTSALWGLFCLKENPKYSSGPYTAGCIIKTKELGFLFVQDLEDLNLNELWEKS